MPEINIIPLGAGQDVGRSCFIINLGSKNIMLDCGMHMGYNDDRRFPDFSHITKSMTLSDYLDCVIISHFHLDHCGALPYMTEMVGYDGPVFMTNPTKAICPILLEDYRKITVEKRGVSNFFTTEMIDKCMKKVRTVNLHEVVKVEEDLEIKAYYAGHVLGAAMFYVRSGSQSILYTGDYNMTPDRHLGAAWVDCCRPDVLITESTYATTIRDSKRGRERDFLEKVHKCVDQGGKVLIPVFALGRAQELCILLETYWERMNLDVPIYFSTGMTQQATAYYKLFISWTNEKIKDTFVDRNMFDFKHIKPLVPGAYESDGPMVVFATPGMLHAGQSLQIFKKWAPNKNNMVILPGYCVAGTIGYKILNGAKKLEFEKNTLDVRLKVEYLSFSAHADAKGIMQLISQCQPANVMLVHGEAAKMEFLKSKIDKEFGLPCYMPANGELLTINTRLPFVVEAPLNFLRRKMHPADCGLEALHKPKTFRAAIVLADDQLRLIDKQELCEVVKDTCAEHELQFTCNLTLSSKLPTKQICSRLIQETSTCLTKLKCPSNTVYATQEGDSFTVMDHVTVLLKDPLYLGKTVTEMGDSHVEDAPLKEFREVSVHITYSFMDEYLGSNVFCSLRDSIEHWKE